ncbi:hypothetical protein Ae263Ps1_3072 [Pseudonocardia sp. Ae263_Ps1]|nr:hypothetical protein Ae150APs1_2248c [Pseudonocardia sp. Ae150A_Ps1]OLL86017.1 hypothetical protein Ae263Ps1_3072 [Pseudonocardia sp. Ae263_Ps1]
MAVCRYCPGEIGSSEVRMASSSKSVLLLVVLGGLPRAR